jgi:talin
VAGAASSQEQLAVAAQNAVATIVQLSDVVKAGAASLGSQNQEAQVSSSQKKVSERKTL